MSGTQDRLGERAVVIGAGVGGLLSAAALDRHFEEVVIVEKDALPSDASFRKGVPQGPHGHIVMKRGENIAEDFFPGFRKALAETGGVELRMGPDTGRFAFGKWSAPVRSDLTVLSQTRPLLERTLREKLVQMSNVQIREHVRFAGLAFDDGRVSGLRVELAGGAFEDIDADLVIDAAGRGTNTPKWLEASGYGVVPTDRLGIDVCYVTGLFETDSFDDGYPKLCTVGDTPPAGRGGAALPVEGGQWMITLNGRGDDLPSTEPDDFAAFAKSLPDDCVYERIIGSRLVGPLRRFKIPESFWRHYESMPAFPSGFLPVGDAIAGFNPVFGQGMSVAAIGAECLADALNSCVGTDEGLEGLHSVYLPEVAASIAEAWEGTATYDLLYDTTKGERPPDYAQRRAVFFAMQELSEDDEELRRKQLEVGNMLESRTSLFTPELVARLTEHLEADRSHE